MLKKSTLLSASIFLVLFIGLSDYGYGCHEGKKHKARGGDCGGGGGGGDDGATDKYSASVLFDDADCHTGMGNRDRFCSDEFDQVDPLGFYSDTEENVGAGGDKFRFALTLQTGTDPAPRSFFLDFSGGCLDPDASVTPSPCGHIPSLGANHKGLTSGTPDNVFSTGEPGFSLLDMVPPNDAGLPTYIRAVWISFRDDIGDGWGLSFSTGGCEGATRVAVTRTANTWYFEAGPVIDTMTQELIGPIACLTRAKNGKSGPPILQGRYIVPFGFTVHVPPLE